MLFQKCDLLFTDVLEQRKRKGIVAGRRSFPKGENRITVKEVKQFLLEWTNKVVGELGARVSLKSTVQNVNLTAGSFCDDMHRSFSELYSTAISLFCASEVLQVHQHSFGQARHLFDASKFKEYVHRASCIVQAETIDLLRTRTLSLLI